MNVLPTSTSVFEERVHLMFESFSHANMYTVLPISEHVLPISQHIIVKSFCVFNLIMSVVTTLVHVINYNYFVMILNTVRRKNIFNEW